MKGYLKYLALVAVFALIATACGDSGSSPFDEAADTAISTTEDTGGGDDGGDDGGGGFGDAGDDTIPVTVGNIPGVSGECEALLNVFLSMSRAFIGGEFVAVDLQSFSELPGDLQDDAALVVDTLNDFAEGLEDMGVDLTDPQWALALTPAQQQAFATLGETLDAEAFTNATDNLSAYGEAECEGFLLGE